MRTSLMLLITAFLFVGCTPCKIPFCAIDGDQLYKVPECINQDNVAHALITPSAEETTKSHVNVVCLGDKND